MNISKFKKIEISNKIIDKFSNTIKSLHHIRINKNTKGFIWVDNNDVVAILNTELKNDTTWIQAFEIFNRYKGQGLSTQILKIAVNDLHATHLSVNKTNKIAIHVYNKHGFEIYDETKYMYFMKLKKSDNKNKMILEAFKDGILDKFETLELLYGSLYINETSNNNECKYIYEKIKTVYEIDEFKKAMKTVFNTGPGLNNNEIRKGMKIIKVKNDIIGYIGFSKYNIDGKKYLGIGNFMLLPDYQRKGHGTNIIKDIININKNEYDEIYCYVDKTNKNAIKFYEKIADVNKSPKNDMYYVTLYKK